MKLLQCQAPAERALLGSSADRTFEFEIWTFEIRMWTLDIRIWTLDIGKRILEDRRCI